MKQKSFNFQEKLIMVAVTAFVSIVLLFIAPYASLAFGLAIGVMLFTSAGHDSSNYHKFYKSRGFAIVLMSGWVFGILLFLFMFSMNLILLLLIGLHGYATYERLKMLSVNITY